MRLKRVSDIQRGELPFSRKTFYAWSSAGKHPELFIRVGGKSLFVDLDALDRWLESKRLSNQKGRRNAAV